MDNNRFIAFFDILGFSKLVESSSVHEVKEKFYTIFSSIFQYQSRKWTKSGCKFVFKGRPEEVNHVMQKMENAYSFIKNNGRISKENDLNTCLQGDFPFNYMIISDSIIVYSNIIKNPCDDFEIFEEFFDFVRIFISNSFMEDLQIRGAVTFGEFFVDKQNSIFFGKGLVEAVQLEKTQEWIGCILSDKLNEVVDKYKKNKYTDSYREKIKIYLIDKSLLLDTVFARYPVPLKEGVFKDHYIVNWYPAIIGKIKLSENLFKTKMTGDHKIDIKYHNTLDYMMWWQLKCTQFFKSHLM